jgi:uncharacterized protein (DUF58 family)
MNISPLRWFNALPPQLQPLGVRYHPASNHHAATLLGKRIFVLPTKQGLGFMALLLVMLLGATNYSNNMAFALTFLLGSMLIISVLHTYRNLVGLQVRLSQVEECFAGGQAGFVMELINADGRLRCDIELLSSAGTTAMVNVAGHDHTHARLMLPAPHRGLLKIGRITLATRYPFGLFRAWSYVDVEGAALVYPRPSTSGLEPRTETAAGEGVPTTEPGSDDFHGLRNYQSGDSLRHIDWKALARERGLLTKQFQRNQSPELWFEWDATGAASIEERLSRLCRWVLDAESQQQRYGLRLPGVEIAPNLGPAQQQRCLRQLALFGIER